MSIGRRLILAFVVVSIWVLVLEAGARAYWALTGDVSPLHPGRILLSFYPELEGEVERELPVADEGRLDVLLLGGSVLHFVGGPLEERLARASEGPVAVHDLAVPAHSSLDSRYKYEGLSDRRFDWVVFYHGINEVRANNVPPGSFRVDYSHYAWYETLSVLHRHPEHGVLAFPFTFHLAFLKVREALGLREYVPRHVPNPEWTAHGSDVRSAESFRANLERILQLARERGDRVLLMTFAWFVPEDYSKERFLENALTYSTTISPPAEPQPIEIWGRPDNVVAGIRAHNRVVREAAERFSDVVFVDQSRLLPKTGEVFADICHFSDAGIAAFLDNMLPELLDPTRRRDR